MGKVYPAHLLKSLLPDSLRVDEKRGAVAITNVNTGRRRIFPVHKLYNSGDEWYIGQLAKFIRGKV